jgi:hypothetical protein
MLVQTAGMQQRLRVSSRTRIRALAGLTCLITLVILCAAALPAGAQPARPGVSSCPLLDLANPSPGDVVSPGNYIVQGTAVDPITLSPSGIARIDFFLGPRDNGGLFLGSTLPGTSPSGGPNAFQATVVMPSVDRDVNFTAYAYSAVYGGTTAVQRAIHIGAPTPTTTHPTPSPVPLSITIKSGCAVAPTGQQQAVGTTTVPVISITQGQGPVLQLANPNAYDVLSRGPLLVSGVAFDPASTNGAGVNIVDYFLDDRDAGGTPLGGNAVPGNVNPAFPRVYNTVITIPATANGQHNIVAYAQSNVTGLETKVSVPVFIGAAPSPTPRP